MPATTSTCTEAVGGLVNAAPSASALGRSRSSMSRSSSTKSCAVPTRARPSRTGPLSDGVQVVVSSNSAASSMGTSLPK
ncbi:hypothetical protein JKP75_14135 [Blastococcus sp. TML/M2B]|nr:hypothetical protein [Blastococcus sp. TML/M2B]